MGKVTLIKMNEGQKGIIAEVCGGSSVQARMMSLGIHPGRQVTKLSHFALRGPVAIRVGRSVIALGHGVAGKIIVQIE